MGSEIGRVGIGDGSAYGMGLGASSLAGIGRSSGLANTNYAKSIPNMTALHTLNII